MNQVACYDWIYFLQYFLLFWKLMTSFSFSIWLGLATFFSKCKGPHNIIFHMIISVNFLPLGILHVEPSILQCGKVICQTFYSAIIQAAFIILFQRCTLSLLFPRFFIFYILSCTLSWFSLAVEDSIGRKYIFWG